MDAKALSRELEVRTGFGRILQGILAVSLCTNFALGIAYATSDRSIRTVYVPPVINKSFWVEDQALSPAYLEQMSLFIAGLLLNVQPASAEYQLGVVKQYLDPRVSAELARKLDVAVQKTKKENVSTYFSFSRAKIDEANKRIALLGGLEVWFAGQRVSSRSTAFLLGFSYENGRFFLNEFRETNDQDPFAPIPAPAAQ